MLRIDGPTLRGCGEVVNWAALLILVLGVARVTHFLADDMLFEPGRKALEKLFRVKGWSPFRCTWCVSIWVAAPAAALAGYEDWIPADWWLRVALWPALSYVAVALEALIEGWYNESE